MKVQFIRRCKEPGCFSIERLFNSVVVELPPQFVAENIEMPWRSRGVLRRICILLYLGALRRPGIYHVTGDIAFGALVLPQQRTIVTVHDCYTLRRLSGWKRLIYGLIWFGLPLRRCAAVTAISAETKRELISYYPELEHKIEVIPDCLPKGLEFVSKEFNRTEPCILQVGTRENKNAERVVRALRGLSCRLVLVGHVSPSLRALIEQAGLKWSALCDATDEEVFALYKECDLVVFASLYEGFGLPIIEAQAVGRPVVTSNAAPMNEVAGGAACLVNPLETESIRAGILRVIQDEPYRRELIRAGVENAKRFAPAAVASAYAALYARVASSRRA